MWCQSGMENSMSISETKASLNAAAEILEKALADGKPEQISPDALGRLMAAVTRGFAALHEASDHNGVFGPQESSVTATDVVVTTSAMLRAANVAVFELDMWQTIMRGRGPAIQGE